MPTASLETATTANTAPLLVTVGKVESGVAIVLTDDMQMFELPSHSLPSPRPGTLLHLVLSAPPAEMSAARVAAASDLQQRLLNRYGREVDGEAVARALHLLKATHTTLTIGWAPWEELSRSGTTLHALDVLLNGRHMPFAVRPGETHLRLTGLDPAKSYALQIRFHTSGGRFTTAPLAASTLPLEDLSCLRVAMVGVSAEERQEILQLGLHEWTAAPAEGPDQPPDLVVASQITLQELMEGDRGGPVLRRLVRERAIPLVTMEWVRACRQGGRMQSVTAFALP